MNLFRSEHLKECIIETLLKGSAVSGKELLETINTTNDYSKQGLYKSLNILITEGVVLKQGTKFLINNLWKEHIVKKLTVESVFPSRLQEGDSLSFSFQNPIETDKVWAHYFLQAYQETTEPIFIYNPHEWFIVAHNQSEQSVFNKFAADKRKLYLMIGGETQFDISFAKKFRSHSISINTGITYGISDYTYINIVGDYLFEAEFTVGFAEDLDIIYQTSKTEEELMERVTQLANSSYKVKLKISRSSKKAEVYRKKFSKDFVI